MKSLKVCASALAVSIMLVVSATASAATAELFASTNFIGPDSLAIDGSGNVYASLGQNTTKDVAKIASNGTANLTWKSGLSDYPYDLSIGPGGSVVVQNGYTKIERLDASGTTLNTYTGLSGLGSVVTDSAGNVWWTSTSRVVGRIPVSTGSGAAPSGVSLGGSEQPSCLAVDAAGNAYFYGAICGAATGGRAGK
jgi:streptogramin lyase